MGVAGDYGLWQAEEIRMKFRAIVETMDIEMDAWLN